MDDVKQAEMPNLELVKEALRNGYVDVQDLVKENSQSFYEKLNAKIMSKPKTVAKVYNALSKVSWSTKKTRAKHKENNLEKLAEEGSAYSATQYTEGYIENQGDEGWKDVKYGSFNMNHAGCGIIATYNALVALGESPDAKDLADIIETYEKSGMVLNAAIGTSPYAVKRYLMKKGHTVDMTFDFSQSNLGTMENKYSTFISLSFNDNKNIFNGGHYVSITRHDNTDENAKTNPYTFKWHNNYPQRDKYYHLYDSVVNLGAGYRQTSEICLLGINK